LQLAVNILEGKPFKKENPLKAALVTKDNAKVLLLQSEEMKKQEEYLDQLHNRADGYLQQLDSQRLIMFLAVGAIVLLLLLLVFIYIYYLQKARMNEEREKMTRDQLDFYTQVSHELRTPLTLIEGPLEQLGATEEMEHASLQTSGLFSIVRRNTGQLTQLINKMLDMQTSNGVVSLQSSSADEMAETHLVETLKEDVTSDNSDTSKTILVVDDNADIRAYLSTILQDRYQIALAADGSQGLALANEIVPDLIVSDVMMPVMNGLEFCQRIKSGIATSHIPVILLTARALSQHQVEGYESGADAYITKPFSPEVLLARITNLLHSRYQLKNLFTATNETKEAGQPTDSAKTASSETKENTFIQKFRQFVEENMSDSGLNVETIGAELGLSRVQLYRKVKALTGVSPVELVRTVRLQRGRELLQTTDKTVSEVAYEVGFSAPSYFTKCFKDEFGVSPSEMQGGAEAGPNS
jgi:DNA-binding response OmpR family regulator